MGDSLWMKRWLWIALLANGCVTSVPVGGNEGSDTSDDDTGADESDTSDDGETDSESTSGSSGDTGQEQLCELEPGAQFEQLWTFGDYEPPQVGYADDGLDFLCSVDAYTVEDDVLDLTLDCTVDGADVPVQELSLSPAPQIVVDALDGGEVLSLQYRAQQSCPNGCFYDAGGGWLAVRDVDDDLLFAQIKGREIANALAEMFDPFSIEYEPSDCAPVLDELCEGDEKGFEVSLDVTITTGDDSVTLTNSGQAQLGAYDLVLSRAFAGETGGCEADAGHRGALWMQIVLSE